MRMAVSLGITTMLVGCATAPSIAPTPRPLRVGHTYNHGNCAVDASGKLTGMCVGSDKANKACMEHEPAPHSPPCKAGDGSITETGAAHCSSPNVQVIVSREPSCFWLNEW